MSYWLLKTEPETFSWDDQVRKGDRGEPWSGVRNYAARRYLQAMRKGERAFFYHTGSERRIVGIVEVIREAYPDPTDPKGEFVCVDVKAVELLPRPVTLAEIKTDPRLADMVLLRQTRLSVQPVSAAQWARVRRLGGLKR